MAFGKALCKKGITEGFEQRSDMIGLQFLLTAEVVYPPIHKESESTRAQVAELGRWEVGTCRSLI